MSRVRLDDRSWLWLAGAAGGGLWTSVVKKVTWRNGEGMSGPVLDGVLW